MHSSISSCFEEICHEQPMNLFTEKNLQGWSPVRTEDLELADIRVLTI